MKRVFSFVAAFVATFLAVSANAENIAPGATYSQNFDSLGTAATASLPGGWGATSSASVRSVTATEWGNAATATEKQGTGTGTNAGIYNWGDAGDTSDRGVGFLASGSAAKTGNLYLSLTATGYIPSFTVSYDMKCYRNNTRSFRFQLYYSTDDGATWMSAGNDFLTSCAVATNGVVVNPAGVTPVSSKTLNVPLASGETVILCWSYSVSSGSTTSNAQGLGIDNVSIVAGSSSGPAPLATPTGLSVSSVTDSGFSLSWTAVEDADDYEVEVLAGSAAAGTVSVSGTGATVTGLSADTDYTAKVKALPPIGSTTLLASGWSAPVAVTTELADGLEWGSVFKEEFSGTSATLTWGGNQFLDGEGDVAPARTDMDTWHGKDLYNAPAALRFGNASKHGWVASPAVSLSNGVSSATVKVTFSAGALAAAAANRMVFSVLDASGETIEIAGVSPKTLTLPVLSLSGTSPTLAEALAASNALPQSLSFTAPAGFKMKFDASQGSANSNIAIDDVLVRQMVDPNFAVLAAPTGVAESDVGKYGFTVSWTGVADASGYEVWLDGAVAGSCASTSTSMTLTGLSDDTTYSVQVRALGDNLHCGDSPLSTAISVTTLADAQKIDFTVAGAPAAPVYAGAAVAFTVTAENESTHEAAEVSFSGIAGASFDSATGAFSWTTTESDVGSHTATFTSGTYSTNVTIEVLSPNRTATLFREDFSRFVTQWNGTSNLAAITNPPPDNAGWTFALATRAPSSLRIGKAIDKKEGEAASIGSALSPEIVLTNNLSSGTVALSFDAAAYFKQTTAMHVVVLDAETGEPVWMSPVLDLGAIDNVVAGGTTIHTVAEGVHTNASFAVPGVPERFRLLFETVSGAADHRLYLDTIVVSQTWDASIPALAAPVPAIGEPGMDSLPVSWSAVSGATGYDLEARLSDGSLAARAANVAGTSYSYTFTGLADGTAYSVRIRALGDGVSAANSPWSDPAAGTTATNPNRPEFTVSAGADAPVEAGTAKTFAVSASRGQTSVPVSFGGLSPSPAVYGSPRFIGGTFSWTPTDDDAGKTFAVTFRAGSYATNVVFAVTARPPLAAPTITNTVLGVMDASFSWDAQSRATGYAVRLWRGSSDYTKDGCFEDFFDCTMPKGWTGKGTGWYPTASDRNDRVQFDATGDELVSKLHSAPVTNLSFHLTLHGSGGDHPSTVSLLASTGGTAEGDWIPVETYSVAAGASGTKEKAFSESDGYRRFKWTFEKTGGNAGLGDIEAKHAGAGAKFAAGFGSAAEARDWGLSTALSASGLRGDTDYCLEVAALEGATEMSAVIRFRTREPDKATVLILK